MESVKMKIDVVGEKPSYANEYSAGLDIVALEPILIQRGNVEEVTTLMRVEIPKGHFGMIVIRSSLGYNHQITLVNNVGIIDEDYRGNIGIKLINNGGKDYQIEKGDRVAQMIIVPYIQPQLEFVDKLSKTERGIGGFGSTGR